MVITLAPGLTLTILLQSYSTMPRNFTRATCRHRSSTLKRVTEGSIVLTIALGIALTIVQPQRRLNSHDFGATDFDYTTAKSADGSIVWTISEFFA
jgi:hypothetical protein